MRNSLKFHGDHYSMLINGKTAKMDVFMKLLNPEDFTYTEQVLIQWSVV